jgi:SHAQKYF class myb-like DNA-binding protein
MDYLNYQTTKQKIFYITRFPKSKTRTKIFEITKHMNKFKPRIILRKPIPIYKGKWKLHEHDSLIMALIKYGTNWNRIRGIIKSRTRIQIISHAQKFFKKAIRRFLKKNKICDLETVLRYVKENILKTNFKYQLVKDEKLSKLVFVEIENYLAKSKLAPKVGKNKVKLFTCHSSRETSLLNSK